MNFYDLLSLSNRVAVFGKIINNYYYQLDFLHFTTTSNGMVKGIFKVNLKYQ